MFLGANVETIASDLQTDLTTILAVWLVLVLLLELLLEGLALWTSGQGTCRHRIRRHQGVYVGFYTYKRGLCWVFQLCWGKGVPPT